jgi:hypothetical protein
MDGVVPLLRLFAFMPYTGIRLHGPTYMR